MPFFVVQVYLFFKNRATESSINKTKEFSLDSNKDILFKEVKNKKNSYLPGKLFYQINAKRTQTRKGDWSYIWNWDGYDSSGGAPWQGENVISLSNGKDIYWGHGVGVASYETIVRLLNKNYNGPDNMRNKYSRGSAWNGVVSFFKVEKIAQEIFDLRKKAKK